MAGVAFVFVGCVNDRKRDHDAHMLGTVVVPSDPRPPPTVVKPTSKPAVTETSTALAAPLSLYDAGPGKQDTVWVGAHAFTYTPDAGSPARYEVVIRADNVTMPVTIHTPKGTLIGQGKSASKDVFDVYFDRCEGVDAGNACAGLLRGAIVVSLSSRGGKVGLSFGALASPNPAIHELPAEAPMRDAGARK